jgi:hypothetical protein
MRRVTQFLAFCSIVALGCAKSEKPAAESMGDPAAAPAAEPAAQAPMATPAPANITAAAVAGKWNVRVARIGSDSAVVTMVFNATGDPSTWTFNFPGRPPVPVNITMDGDSIMASAGPYTSALRKGVKVTTNGVMRLLDDKLVGTTTAHYQVKTADSVLTLSFLGVRAP